jgi:HK97 family phage prohead protease
MLLGKTQSGNFSVSEDEKGLKFSLHQIPDTTYANDLVSLMDLGLSYECSFGFSVVDPKGEEWSQLPDGEILRSITRAVLYEGSILTGPAAAYPNTSASLRSCPKNLRKLVAKRDDEDDDDELDDVCNPDSDSYDPDACQALKDDDEDDEDREICPECGQSIPSEEDADDDEERQAHLQLLIRRMK